MKPRARFLEGIRGATRTMYARSVWAAGGMIRGGVTVEEVTKKAREVRAIRSGSVASFIEFPPYGH